MRFSPECVPCLLNRVIYETELVAPEKVAEALSASMSILSQTDWSHRNSAEVATTVHRKVYQISGSEDPYKDLKRRSDEVAESIFERTEHFVHGSEDPFEAAALCSIAGNVLDFGIDVGFERPEQLGMKFDSLVKEGLAINDLPEARKLLTKAEKVVYLLDNCGESVFDRLLVEQVKSLGPKIIGVVKGEPILTDVTMEDALRVHLERSFDELISTEEFAVGVDLRRAGTRLRKEIEEADLVIAKGMANLESLSDEPVRPVLYLLRTKCAPVAKTIGSKRNANVAKLFV
jgi:damage-control phosphatase, subfamily I